MKYILSFLLFIFSSVLSAQEYAYEWRGLMIDVSRHFMPISYLYKEVDAMEHFGLNRMHLHLTDAAGWRIEIKSRPRLTDVGAWRTARDWNTWWNGERRYSDSTHGFGGFYSHEEMKALVEYAKQHHVEIIPEIEFPAHSEETIAAYPEIGFNHAELNMKSDATYQLMRDVLEEVAEIFPSKYIHIGGDEASTQRDLQPEGMRRIKNITDSLGKKMIVWDEALTNEPSDSDMIIMVWRSLEIAKKAVALGHDVILCPGKYCYLDKAQDSPENEPASAGGYLPIDSVYLMPNPFGKESSNHILGIQGNLWTEYIPEAEHAEYMLWPRAFAIAEIGRVGLTDKRNAKSFHKRAIEACKYLKNTLNINAFDLQREIGERSCKVAKSIHFSIHYNTPAHEAYPGNGGKTLCDGVIGGWNNNDGKWQGFIGSQGMDIILDLGKVKRIKDVVGDFMQSCGPDIFFPHGIVISISTDGENYKLLSKKDFSGIYAAKREDYRQLGWTGRAKARYIRLQAFRGERQGWIFCSEIIVR